MKTTIYDDLARNHFDSLCDACAVLVFLVSDTDRIAGKQRGQLKMVQLMTDIAMIRNDDADAKLISAARTDVKSSIGNINALNPPFQRQHPCACDGFLLRCIDHGVDPPVCSFAQQ